MIMIVVSQMLIFLRPIPQTCAHEFFFFFGGRVGIPSTHTSPSPGNWRLMCFDISFPLMFSILTDNTSDTFVLCKAFIKATEVDLLSGRQEKDEGKDPMHTICPPKFYICQAWVPGE